MTKLSIILSLLLITIFSCNQQETNKKNKTNEKNKTAMDTNPLLAKFDTQFEIPPFGKIKNKHYIPAFKQAIKKHNQEIDAIIRNKEKPTFENTLVALDNSGDLLSRISSIFYALKSANSNDSIIEIAKEIAPFISKHEDDISLNPKLFKKVKYVYEHKNEFKLNTEQNSLLNKVFQNFVRGGSNIEDSKKERFREINKKLSLASLKFAENILKENNKYNIIIENKDDLSGLPNSVIQTAKEKAKEKDLHGKWMFTVQKSSLIPFITYSDNRKLREKLFKAYINRGNNNDENDNKEIIKEIINLRIEKANLLGFKSHADYILDVNMAKKPKNVYKLLNKIWVAALPVAKKEAEELQKTIIKDGKNFKLEPWDWWYYSEKIRKEKYDLDQEELRKYFKLQNVRQGMFILANKLYGITFTPLNNLPSYHKDAETFEVKEADGTHIGIFYTDYFPRDSKKGGAWMTSFRKQSRINGKDIKPIIMNVCNFTKPTQNKPALLSFEEVNTMFHEFGHALHGLLSDCTYTTLSGTSVARDFVELPSQLMENWASQPEMLKLYAKHYKTGKTIPDSLIEKLQNSSNFNTGFKTVEYIAAAYLDMFWHTLKKQDKNIDINEFEKTALSNIGLFPQIVVRYKSTNFSHIFSGGYSSGYYGYEWAAVLDADVFQAFKETSLFDKNTASKFRKELLSKGGTDDAMTLYKNFRGREPSIEPLLKRKALLN